MPWPLLQRSFSCIYFYMGTSHVDCAIWARQKTERETESESERKREREKECVFMWDRSSIVYVSKKESVCVCVWCCDAKCVCLCEKECGGGREATIKGLASLRIFLLSLRPLQLRDRFIRSNFVPREKQQSFTMTKKVRNLKEWEGFSTNNFCHNNKN